MQTVKQVSRRTGISIRTLHHYDAIGLLKPTAVTEAGYRLYDEAALERLYLVLVYRELGFPLGRIREILEAPDYDRNRILDDQIRLLQAKVAHLQNRIHLAGAMKQTGVNSMNWTGFDPQTIDEHTTQAEVLYGKTDAWQEFKKKSEGRTPDREQALGNDLMALFARLGTLRQLPPDSEAVQDWVRQLQAFISEHYYRCTPQILKGLGEMYAGGGSMTENIDRAGGAGTGEFARQAIRIYCGR